MFIKICISVAAVVALSIAPISMACAQDRETEEGAQRILQDLNQASAAYVRAEDSGMNQYAPDRSLMKAKEEQRSGMIRQEEESDATVSNAMAENTWY